MWERSERRWGHEGSEERKGHYNTKPMSSASPPYDSKGLGDAERVPGAGRGEGRQRRIVEMTGEQFNDKISAISLVMGA